MKLSVVWRTALKALLKNRKRSLLTMLGIVIGIAAVIAIMSIGRGYQKEFMKQMSNNEGENISVRVMFVPEDSNMNTGNIKFFQEVDLNRVKEIEGVQSVKIPDSQFGEDTTTGKNTVSLQMEVNGKKRYENIELVKGAGTKPSLGRNLNKSDNLMHNKVAVINDSLAKSLYKSEKNALNRGIGINGQLFTIVGVFKGQEFSIFSPQETSIFIPADAYGDYFEKASINDQVVVSIDKKAAPNKVMKKVKKQLDNEGSMRSLGEYQLLDTSLLTEGMGQVISGLTYFISAIAGISLFIAGVGVMNMMYISVSERTKEIGIRRALGATAGSIKMQFLLEGITITLIGGIIGYLLGIALAYVISMFLPFAISIDLFTIILAVGVSTVIGLIFSVMPASSAAKKDLIEILR